ncbi:MAG TPA: hypothetical protein VFZ59_02860 [Verrucomicrobiae bacterium]|nr:hypothetical protein [Verrucomicrobiae bacterium]
MKKSLLLAALMGFQMLTFGQGMMNWNNTFATLITDGTLGSPMPFRVSPQTTYYFGLFIAPYGTPAPLPGFPGIHDPNWQNVVSYTMNSTAPGGVGRFENPGVTAIPGYAPGETVSFVIRGWHSSAGGADWETAKFGLSPANYGQSHLGFGPIGGGMYPVWSAFGNLDEPYGKQINGFIIGIPEPTSLTLSGLGAALCFVFCQRKRE